MHGFGRSSHVWRRRWVPLARAALAVALLLPLSSASGQQTPADASTISPPSNAQTDTTPRLTTRSIEGRILTAAGAPAPGAVVLIKDSKSLQVRSYIAQGDGQYHFFGLSTDVNYTLRAEHAGLTSKQKTVSVFDSHRKVKLDLKLTKKMQPAKKPEAKPAAK